MTEVLTPEVMTDDDILDRCAANIREAQQAGKSAAFDLADQYVTIGRELSRARAFFTEDAKYGAWLKAKDFGFSTEWARILRTAADNETAFRELVATRVATTGKFNVKEAVRELAPPTPSPRKKSRSETGPDNQDDAPGGPDEESGVAPVVPSSGPSPLAITAVVHKNGGRMVELIVEKGATPPPVGARVLVSVLEDGAA